MRSWTFWLIAILALGTAASLSLWLLASSGYFMRPESPEDLELTESDRPVERGGLVMLSAEEVERMGIRVRKLQAAVGQVEVAAQGWLHEDLTRLVTLRAPVPGTLRAVDELRWPTPGELIPAGSVIGLLETSAPTQPASQPTTTQAADSPDGRMVPLKLNIQGRVLDVAAQPGQQLENRQIILRLVRYDQFAAHVKLPPEVPVPADLTAARMTIGGHESWPLMGRYVGAKESSDKSQVLIFAVPSRGYPLTPGMTVVANLPVGDRSRRGVNLPEAAVLEMDGRTWVWVQRDTTSFERRAVRLGAETSLGWFTSEGLRPDDLVVVQGGTSLMAIEMKSRGEPAS